MKAYEHLIQRIEDGRGADRLLDAEIECSLPQTENVRSITPSLSVPGKVTRRYTTSTGGSSGTAWASEFTSSLDAAARLAKRLLPGWTIRLQCNDEGACEASVEVDIGLAAIAAEDTRSSAATPARALLAAVLRAYRGIRS